MLYKTSGSPGTDEAMFQILTQDDQPKPKELLWVGLDPSITYSTQKPSRALVEGPHLGKLLSLKLNWIEVDIPVRAYSPYWKGGAADYRYPKNSVLTAGLLKLSSLD